ncbi:ABC transporter permease subunit [Nocardioides sp.]|uniref:branched-chain amino acid ABC transporter ATP-binding protein/permease n=1 Tax=Nocardioides sp. TaxID=35761 RepID=UPI0037843FAE
MTPWIDALNQGLIIGVFAVSLNVLLGHAGLLSVATVGLGGVGGYAAAYLSLSEDWPAGAALLAAAMLGLAAGAVVGLPALRLGPDYVIVLTLAFGTIIGALAAAVPSLGGTQGLVGLEALDIGGRLLRPIDLLRFVLPLAALMFFLCWRLVHSPFGRVLRGIREDEVAVEALGKPVVRFKVTAFALTSVVAAIAGAMLVFYQQLASPSQFGFGTTTAVVAAVVIGGTGNLVGSIVGAIGLSMIRPALQELLLLPPIDAAQWQLVCFGLLLILVLVLRPAGLLPERLRTHDDHRETEPPVEHGADRSRAFGSDERRHEESSSSALTATHISKSFGAITAVDDLTLNLRPGQVTALLGPNGAGKTTVFNLLTGRTRTDSGEVVLHGRTITDCPVHRGVLLGMARTFQDVRIFKRLTVLDNVAMAVPNQAGERLRHLYLRPGMVRLSERSTVAVARGWLDFVGLTEHAGRAAGSLGFGEQKLLTVARALATGADVILLDEPASGIDRASLEPVLELVERLRDTGRTICLVEHNLDVVDRLADSVLFMEQGRVTATGSMEEIRQIDRLAEVYFGQS